MPKTYFSSALTLPTNTLAYLPVSSVTNKIIFIATINAFKLFFSSTLLTKTLAYLPVSSVTNKIIFVISVHV